MDYDAAKGGIEILETIGTVGKTILGVLRAIFYLPETISTFIAGIIHGIVPGDPKIDSTVAMVVALFCTYLWFSKWDKVRKMFSDGLGLIPFGAVPIPVLGQLVALFGSALKLLVWYTHYILFAAIWGVTRSGWIAAIVVLVITGLINAPEKMSKLWAWLKSAGNKSVSLATEGGDVIKKGIKLIPTVNLTDPVNKAFEEQLKGMHRQCVDRGTNTLKNEEFISMAEAFKALVLQEHADREGDLSQILEKFQEKHGIRTVKVKPITKALLLELGQKITD